MKRFTVAPVGRALFIQDNNGGGRTPVGPGSLVGSGGLHRLDYTIDDTQATVDWLNERAASYPAPWPVNHLVRS